MITKKNVKIVVELFLDIVTASLRAGIDTYWNYRFRIREKNLKSLRSAWTLPTGTIVTLNKSIVCDDMTYEAGYSPMLMDVQFPVLADEWHLQDPVVFVFWCSGRRVKYRLRLDEWGGKLPFEVTSGLTDSGLAE